MDTGVSRLCLVLMVGCIQLSLGADKPKAAWRLTSAQEQGFLSRAREVVKVVTGNTMPADVEWKIRVEEVEDRYGCEGRCSEIIVRFQSHGTIQCSFDTNGILRTYWYASSSQDTGGDDGSQFSGAPGPSVAARPQTEQPMATTRLWGKTREDAAENIREALFPGYVGLQKEPRSDQSMPFAYSKIADGIRVSGEFVRIEIADDLTPRSIWNFVTRPYDQVVVNPKIMKEDASAIARRVAENEPRRRFWKKYYSADMTGYVPRVLEKKISYRFAQPNWEFVGGDAKQSRFVPQKGQSRRWVYECPVCYVREGSTETLSVSLVIWVDVHTGEVMGGQRGATGAGCLD